MQTSTWSGQDFRYPPAAEKIVVLLWSSGGQSGVKNVSETKGGSLNLFI